MERGYKFSVLTLNVWGLPWVLTPNKTERLVAVAQKLKNCSFDVVCLQELWVESDFKLLSQLTSPSFPYSHYFHSGVLGSGLAVLSKWKIVMSFYHQWPLNGYVHMIQHADWFGGKGVGLVQIKFKELLVNVYNTHLHAQYSHEDRYIAHRVVQSLDTGLFTRITSLGAHVTFFCGDMNSEPGDICYNLITDLANLKDSHNAQLNPVKTWGTCGSSRISFTNLEDLKKDPKGKRLDHIFFKTKKNLEAIAEEYFFPFEEMIPGKVFSYSDHEAVGARFLIKKSQTIQDEDNTEKMADLEKALSICYQALSDVSNNTKIYWKVFICLILLICLHPLGFYFSHLFYLAVLPSVLILLFYSLFMATFWHRLETRGLLGAISRLKTTMNS